MTREVTDHDAAQTLGENHPKRQPPPLHRFFAPYDQGGAGAPGAGAAPGANGPPTTGGLAPGGSLTPA